MRIEWPTLLLAVFCYVLWFATAFWPGHLPPLLAVPLLALAMVLHASLSHETIHGHPFAQPRWNGALMSLPIGLLVPYGRFRDTHLAHHRDADLTDPYDDPESNYLDPAVWAGLPVWTKRLLLVNNTLAGRILLGPVIGQAAFMAGDLRAIRAGERGILREWLWHGLGVAGILLAVALWGTVPLWAYLAAAYLAAGVLKIRTFLEHQAHDRARGRTAIVEDRGPLAFLFLNNNLHVVHHMHPRVPWYRLPELYRAQQARFRAVNDNYVYRSYGEVFARHLLRRKDPVAHPLRAARAMDQGAARATGQGEALRP
ncbi:fatty acid desaturase [Oceaniglobus roseus]|uniref:fatty acid desaturase n=1 Tax=Oceaniglobus roseus TaxID=1737570 RepID=UPI001FE79248|nr:fatty acid desaturase [Kandeliimicrobium roseum]